VGRREKFQKQKRKKKLGGGQGENKVPKNKNWVGGEEKIEFQKK
jgi:hypothetical protein